MATVNAFKIAGTKIWFWSNDHTPAHFHAKRNGEWEVKVKFLLDQSDMIEIISSQRAISRKVLKELTQLAEEHRAALLMQWEDVQST
jgi:hypothetical protein